MCLKSVAQSTYAKASIGVVLAMEEREVGAEGPTPLPVTTDRCPRTLSRRISKISREKPEQYLFIGTSCKCSCCACSHQRCFNSLRPAVLPELCRSQPFIGRDASVVSWVTGPAFHLTCLRPMLVPWPLLSGFSMAVSSITVATCRKRYRNIPLTCCGSPTATQKEVVDVVG